MKEREETRRTGEEGQEGGGEKEEGGKEGRRERCYIDRGCKILFATSIIENIRYGRSSI